MADNDIPYRQPVVTTAEDLFQMLLKLSPEERKQRQVFVQVPSSEYESYWTEPYRIEVGNISDYQRSDTGTPALCFVTED